MKLRLLFVLAAVAGLSGCYAYGGGPYGAGYYNDGYYGGYRSHDRGYYDRRDRDGDGVPNWRDTRPDNPYRR